MADFGKLHWMIPAGNIPFTNSGNEPEMLGQDRVAILNMNKAVANIEIYIYFVDEKVWGPYCLTVDPERVRKVRFNDLIDPQAIPLEKEFGASVQSDVPVVVQFTRLNPKQNKLALMSTMAYGE